MTDGAPRGPARFTTTRWDVVLATRGHGGDARAALESLCASYWFPLYAYARRRGAAADDAQDLVQGFFVVLLERGSFADADPQLGRFRTFLLTAFQRHCSHEHARATAAKRGGGREILPFDTGDGERRYLLEPADERTPEDEYERRWALAVLARSVDRLRDAAGDDGGRTAALLPHVGGPGEARPYAELAERLGTTEGAVKVAVHRMRRRLRALLRDEVAQTVPSAASDAEIDDEIRRLFAALT